MHLFRGVSSHRYEGTGSELDPEIWVKVWDVVEGMRLKSLRVWLEYCGREEECTMDAEWVKPLLKVKGIEKVGLSIYVEVGILTHVILEDMPRKIEKQWTSV